MHLVRFSPTDRNVEPTCIGAYETAQLARTRIGYDCYAQAASHRRFGETHESKAYGRIADEMANPHVTESWFDVIVDSANSNNPRTIGTYQITEWAQNHPVIITADIDPYPISVRQGESGRIVSNSDMIGIRLDTHHDDLDEWDNIVYLWQVDTDLDYTDNVKGITQTVYDALRNRRISITTTTHGTHTLNIPDTTTLERLQVICDIIRQDDDHDDTERAAITDTAQRIYHVIASALAHH